MDGVRHGRFNHCTLMSIPNRTSPWPAVLLVTGLLGCWIAWRQVESLVANSKSLPILASAVFSDGVRLEVYDAALGGETGFSRHTRPNLVPSVSNGASQGYEGGGLSFETLFQDGQFASFALSNQWQTPMLGIVFRLLGSDNRPLSTDRFHSLGELLQITRSGSRFIKLSGLGDIHPHEERLDWSVEVEDGRGGWLLMASPIVADSEDGRAIAVCHVYPRDREKLRIRISRKKGVERESVEVAVPTPGFMPSFSALSPESLPTVRNTGEYEVTLREINDLGGWLVDPKIEVRHPVAASDAFSIAMKFEDRFGNVIPHMKGMMPLPGEDVLRVVGEVNRDPALFPYLESEVEIIAEVIWSTDPNRRQILLTESAKARGIESLVLTPGSGVKEGRRQLPWQLDVQVRGTMSEADWNAWERDMDRQLICVFLGGEERARGESKSKGGNWRKQKGRVDFAFDVGWSGELAEGMSIRIGNPRKMPPERFSFQAAIKSAK
jgi:hypothetical protein